MDQNKLAQVGSVILQALSQAGLAGNMGGDSDMLSQLQMPEANTEKLESWQDVTAPQIGNPERPKSPIWSGPTFLKDQMAKQAMAQGGAAPYMEPDYDGDENLKWLMLQQSGGMA